MSRIIASSAIRGAHSLAKQARESLAKVIEEKGKDCKVEFPNTAYYLPIIYSMTGLTVETLADMEKVVAEIDQLLPEEVFEEAWLPYLGPALDRSEERRGGKE